MNNAHRLVSDTGAVSSDAIAWLPCRNPSEHETTQDGRQGVRLASDPGARACLLSSPFWARSDSGASGSPPLLTRGVMSPCSVCFPNLTVNPERPETPSTLGPTRRCFAHVW